MPDDKSPFHRGEIEIQSRFGDPAKSAKIGRRMIRGEMPAQHREFFAGLPLLLVGTLDEAGRPWASALAGAPGFVRATDPRTLEVTARPIYGDPLRAALVDGAEIGALGIDFQSRRRNRLNGTLANCGLDGFAIAVEQSFGNCPKYIQARGWTFGDGLGRIGEEREVRHGEALDKRDAALIADADTLFIASHFAEGAADRRHGVDLSHRGGRPGFVLVAHESQLLIPDYAGNKLFSTLGNLAANPKCGLLFIDFRTGDTLQLTGSAEILADPPHVARFALTGGIAAERVLAVAIEATIRIAGALPIDWRFESFAPELGAPDAEAGAGPAHVAAAPMTLKSVNVSMPQRISHGGKTVTTGIFKQPVAGRVMARRMNLDGDGQADLWGHGGSFRAIYVYSLENYAYWAAELDRDDFSFGQFGENFTVEGMADDAVHVGDVYRLGGALLEVSQPRVPCFKLAIKMGIDNFQKRFLASGRIGFYFRVLEEGEVGAGDRFELVRRTPDALTVAAVNTLLYFDKQDIAGARQALAIPALSHGWKGSFEDRLVSAETSPGLRDLVVDRKIVESETITSFYLAAVDEAPLAPFLPGQFLIFQLTLPDRQETVVRTYSLSDRPDRDYYRVSIKRELAPADRPELPPGLSSNFFHDRVAVGAKLRVGAPRGKFHLDPASSRAVVLLSAGVGLTPMISMLNAIVDQADNGRQVWFLHGARDGAGHAFGGHVRALAAGHANVHAHIRYSRPAPGDVLGRDYDSRGHLDIDLLKQQLPFDDYEFYLCGPPPFMRTFHDGLLAMGVAEGRVHYEFFGPATVIKPPAPAAAAPAPEAAATGDLQVTFAGAALTANWDPACDNILEFAEQLGLSPPYSCRSGICRTCAAKLIEGEVTYVEDPLEPPAPGTVLICCSRPKTSLVVEV